MKVLNSPLVLTETWWWFGSAPPSALPNQPFSAREGWRLLSGLGQFTLPGPQCLLFPCWERCKGFQAEIWQWFLLRESVGRVPGRYLLLQGENPPCEPSGELEVQIQAALNSALIVLRSTKQSSTLRQLFQLRCPNAAL